MAMDVQSGNHDVQEKVQGAANGILATVHSYANEIASEGKVYLDMTISAEQRNDVSEKLQAFIHANPRLSAFIGVNLLLSGLPLGIFILFTVTVIVSSLVTGFLLGLIGAVIFILFTVGTALCILLPMMFFTTTCALLLFVGGLVGYHVLNWASGGFGAQESPNGVFGEKLKGLALGESSGLQQGEQTQKSIDGFIDNITESQSANHSSVKSNRDTEKAQGRSESASQKSNQTNRMDGAPKSQLVVTSTA